ncbi:Eco57I restriction-modification methylase domain-containing protein, partial [Kaistella sp.]|uniref:Eco57I restriction-modification methylase domain-containing protein n=1 Tax=Kaistella sp. TaxID=2782235 RepID=UPI002F94BAEA
KVNFFKDKLQYLFYEALAKERDSVNSYYKRFDCRIPFLNGGLFEADYNWQEAHITIPENLFRNDEKNKAGDVGTGILDVFDRYNFTIKEDEPLDKEVAVDPEMLGKVFENMLDITERKSKGAFYTPREIVHYMCQESLIHYVDNALNSGTSTYQELGSEQTKLFGGSTDKKGNLKLELEHTDNIRVPKADIETFIREGHFALENDERVAAKGETKTYQYQLPESIRKNADLIDQKLSNIKICDPAIGSGAFPVGLLHELVNAMLVLKPHLSYDYLTEKLKGFGFAQRESISDSRYIYRLKRHIIQESIYGVDIDSSAIDIARLRLWLSLVVDEDDLDPIETLPNLDYKIVAGNSLIGLPEGAMRDLNVEAELEQLKDKFYDITDEKEKKALRQQINTKIRELLDSAEQFAGYKIDFDFKLFFSEVWREKGGFDVVIGNPPYVVDTTLEKWQKDFFIRNYVSAVYQINLYMLFMELAFKLNKPNGFNSYIVPNTWLVNKLVAPFRKYLLTNCNLISIVDLTEEQVFDATVLPVIFTAINNNLKSKLRIINGTGYKFTERAILSRERVLNQPNYLINYQISDLDWDILLKIERNTFFLEEIAKSSFGVKFYQKGKGVPKQDEYIVSNHTFTHDEPIDDTCLNILEGKNLDRFYFTPSNKYIQYGKWLAEPRDEEMFVGERVLVRRIVGQTGLIAAFVDGQFCNNSLLHVVKPYNVSSRALAALINSDLIGYYFIKKFARKEKTFPEIRIHELNSLPISKNFDSEILGLTYFYTSESILRNQPLLSAFFISVINSVIFEFYFPEEIKSAGKEILKHLGDLKPITKDMSEEEKLAIIQSEFERFYDPNHPVRFAIETLDSVEEVRIIKEALK